MNDVDENNVTALRFAGKLALSRYLAVVEATRVSGLGYHVFYNMCVCSVIFPPQVLFYEQCTYLCYFEYRQRCPKTTPDSESCK